MEIVYMLMMTCITSKVSTYYMEKRYSCFSETWQWNWRKGLTCPIRADILDVYSKLEKCIVVLDDLETICVKEWYLCKGNLVNPSALSWRNCVEPLYVNFCGSDICEVCEAILWSKIELRNNLYSRSLITCLGSELFL